MDVDLSATGPGVNPSCPLCHTSHNCFSDLLTHCRISHAGHPFSASDFAPYEAFICASCAAPFTSGRGLSTHNLRSHRPLQPTALPDAILSRYQSLAPLPARYRPLPARLVKPFLAACSRLGKAYERDPSEIDLFHLLTLPKVGLVAGTKPSLADLSTRLAAFPEVPWPVPPSARPSNYTPSPADRASLLVQQGRLATAARVITSDSSPAVIDESTIDILDSLHPDGPAHPFPAAPRVDPTEPMDDDHILATLRSLSSFSSPGISGWTVPLLRLASKSPPFVSFLKTLANHILEGRAPGTSLLTASRLLPIAKANRGIRPIAVGEIFYRLSMKAISRHVFDSSCLLPNQFGVGTPGGVEAVLHAVCLALDDKLPTKFSHITSLDASNAFNCISRKLIASSTLNFLPALFKTARWAYNSQSLLLLPPKSGLSPPDQSEPLLLHSRQGVRQGDPLGPLLFSLAIRPFLKDLITALGPDHLVLAYLDDIFILGPDEKCLDNVTSFMDGRDAPISLNPSKCATKTLESVRTEGFKILGSCLGPVNARAEFLSKAVQQEETKLQRLDALDHQSALLLLRICLQQNLRHLQRSLESHDLHHLWTRLDCAIISQHNRIRGAPAPSTPGSAARLLLPTLPARLGGMGLLSFRQVAPKAFAASTDLASSVLSKLIPAIPSPSPGFLSQKDRCAPFFLHLRNQLFSVLSPTERLRVLENASFVGRRWLSVIPHCPQTILSNAEIASALHFRSLHNPFGGSTCRQCHNPYSLGHSENCSAGRANRTRRHNDVLWAIVHAFRITKGVSATAEPIIGHTTSRNDISIRGTLESQVPPMDLDVTVHSLARIGISPDEAGSSTPATLAIATPTSDLVAQAEAAFQKIASSWARVKLNKVARNLSYTNRHIFHPVVFSSGGSPDADTAKLFQSWKKFLPPYAYQSLITAMSIIFLKARAEGMRVE